MSILFDMCRLIIFPPNLKQKEIMYESTKYENENDSIQLDNSSDEANNNKTTTVEPDNTAGISSAVQTSATSENVQKRKRRSFKINK